jgi:histidyl-tRNA synthetase
MPDAMRAKVKPRTVKGFRDIMPHQVVARRRVIETIRKAFERYGFLPLETPAVENVDALEGLGEEGSKMLFRMTSPEGDAIALRYDLTVPLARVVAQYQNLPRPFRRYQVSPVWRADKPDPGRFREFIQFDIDSVGAPTVLADAEILMAMDEALRNLELKFKIRFSSRKLLNTILLWAGVPADRCQSTMRVMDKFDKIGLKEMLFEMGAGRTDRSGDKIRGLELSPAAIDKIGEFYESYAAPRAGGNPAGVEALAPLADLFKDVKGSAEAIQEMIELDSYLRIARIPPERIALDMSLARGLDYYTGPIFEATLTDLPRFGSIFGGGRYDGLVERFSGQGAPATGASIGIDRLVAAMEKLGLVSEKWAVAKVLITIMDKDRIADYLAMAMEVRDAGIPAELYVGGNKPLKKQFSYADRLGIPLVIIAGSNEFDEGTVSIKDLGEGKAEGAGTESRDTWVKERFGQVTVKRAEMISFLQEHLGPES